MIDVRNLFEKPPLTSSPIVSEPTPFLSHDLAPTSHSIALPLSVTSIYLEIKNESWTNRAILLMCTQCLEDGKS